MAMIPCPKCGENISEQSKFCIYCGAKFVKDVCPACGAEVEENAKFCANCGSQIGEAKPAPVQKTETEAEQKEEGQEIPGPFEIVEGWKQSSAFARFLCSGWFKLAFFLFAIFSAIFTVGIPILGVFAGFSKYIVYFTFFLLIYCLAFLSTLIHTLSSSYCQFSISRWIENQGYDPLAIARQIARVTPQKDLWRLNDGGVARINATVHHPSMIVDAAFMVNRRAEKRHAIIWTVIPFVVNSLLLFFWFIILFISVPSLYNISDAGFFVFLFAGIGTILANPLFWIALPMGIAHSIVIHIISSKKKKRKSVWLSSVY